ncbi:hypothetical protein PO909_005094 [Leuciscus waleckii]
MSNTKPKLHLVFIDTSDSSVVYVCLCVVCVPAEDLMCCVLCVVDLRSRCGVCVVCVPAEDLMCCVLLTSGLCVVCVPAEDLMCCVLLTSGLGAVCVVCVPAVNMSVQLQQNVSLPCDSHSKSSIVLAWFRLGSGENMTLLVSASRGVLQREAFIVEHNKEESRFELQADGRLESVSLRIFSVRGEDLGLYFCSTGTSLRNLRFGTAVRLTLTAAGYWQDLAHAVVYADPEHRKHAQWVTCPVSMLAMQELGCFQLPGIVYRSLQHVPCIIMLQHEVMVVDEWHNNGPQDLVTVSLCIQHAINKMHLCSLSITYACPYHNPTATMGHSIHSVDISKPLTHTTPYTLSAICPVQ